MPVSDETKRKILEVKKESVDKTISDLLDKIDLDESPADGYPDALSLWNHARARLEAMTAKELDDIWYRIQNRRQPRPS